MKEIIYILINFILIFILCEKYSFIQITDTHIGEGEGERSSQLQHEHVSENYIHIIDHIIQISSSINLKFIFHTGDLTSSAMHDQWEEMMKITEKLNDHGIPWIPILGNHDIWAYNETYEEEKPTGDYVFYEYMKDIFLKNERIVNYTGTKKVYNVEHDIYSYFQNFQYEYGKMVFISPDWISRKHAVQELGYKGGFPSAELHDFEGGSYRWFEERLGDIYKRIESISQIVILQHHSFRCPVYIPCTIYSFSEHKRLMIQKAIEKSKIPLDLIWGDVCGHLHMWEYWDPFLEYGKNFKEWIGKAVKVSPCFTIFTVDDGKIIDIQKVDL